MSCSKWTKQSRTSWCKNLYFLNFYNCTKGQKILKAIYDILNSPKNEWKNKKNQPNITMIPQVNFFLFVFGRIEDTIICFRDLMTFNQTVYSFRFLHPNHLFQSAFLLLQLKPLITSLKNGLFQKLFTRTIFKTSYHFCFYVC